MELVAKTFAGLEEVLSKELKQLGARNIRIQRRAVVFEGDKTLLYKANFYLRTALRILKPLYSFTITDVEDMYNQVKNLPWEDLFGVKQTFLIESTVYSEIVTNGRFATYRVKDAIVDRFQERVGERPSISVSNPHIYLNLYISHNQCTISLDSSGEALYKRGYRVAQTEAPLNEVLAAGMVLQSGWNGQCDFLDPMCGSGTIAIEAALIALNMAPGLFRKHYAFERWMDFDADLFEQIYNDDSGERSFEHRIYASDISPKAVSIALQNIKSAGLGRYIDVQVVDFLKRAPLPAPLCIITNPPYGERLGGDIATLYSNMGSTLKHNYAGCDAWIISSSKIGFEKLGLKPESKQMLQNGELDCEYRHYHLFEGKRNDFKRQELKKTKFNRNTREFHKKG